MPSTAHDPICNDTRQINQQLVSLCNEADEGYHRLGARICAVSAPLLVIVHPGDMTEVDASDVVARYSDEKQQALAEVIRSWQGDFALLHRQSSVEFMEGSSRANEWLTKQLERILENAVLVCYGDDLEAFANDLTPFCSGRPSVVVTGAYKCPEHGCVDEVARRLQAAVQKVLIHWSAYEVPDEDALYDEDEDGDDDEDDEDDDGDDDAGADA